MLPSPTAFERVSRDAGLALDGPEFFGQSYADTLEHWLDRFEAALPDVRALGFDERFVRMWRYYLAYCRAGFRVGTIDVMRVGLSAD
jgi:cyclopropane-fatty-acyl-phospholipid synthase